jgi:hypothetical protein
MSRSPPVHVSDTTAVTNLAAVGRLDLMQRIFGRIVIPEAVFRELTDHGDQIPGAVAARTASWIEIRPVVDHGLVGRLQQSFTLATPLQRCRASAGALRPGALRRSGALRRGNGAQRGAAEPRIGVPRQTAARHGARCPAGPAGARRRHRPHRAGASTPRRAAGLDALPGLRLGTRRKKGSHGAAKPRRPRRQNSSLLRVSVPPCEPSLLFSARTEALPRYASSRLCRPGAAHWRQSRRARFPK